MNEWKIAKYIRLSQADRDLCSNDMKKESESISHQRDLIETYIAGQPELRGCEQIEFYDDGYSGTNFARPSFERMLEKIKRGELNCVIVKDFSRFGRDYIELGDYLERIFPVLGVRFISINDRYDSINYKGTTGGMDVVMKNIVYTYYSRDLSTKVKSAKRMKMRQGLLVNGMVPYGYIKDPNDHGKMIIEPEAAKVVREIFDLFLSGMKLDHIAVLMNDRGYETPGKHYKKINPKQKMYDNNSEMRCWNGSMIKRILVRKAYYGAVVSHTLEHIDWSRKNCTRVPEEEQIVVEGMHEPIISKEEYLQVQAMFQKTNRRTEIKGDYPLFKKVRCGTCGRSCRRDLRNSVLDPHMAYFCNYARSQAGEHRCTMDVIEEERLHQIIWEELQRLIFLVDINRDRINDELIKAGREQEELNQQQADLKKAIQKNETKKLELMEKYLVKKITKERFQEGKELLEKEIATYEQQMAEVRDKLAELAEWRNVKIPEDFARIRRCTDAKEFTKELADLTVDQVIFYDREHIDIRWKFTDGFLKMAGMKEEALG